MLTLLNILYEWRESKYRQWHSSHPINQQNIFEQIKGVEFRFKVILLPLWKTMRFKWSSFLFLLTEPWILFKIGTATILCCSRFVWARELTSMWSFSITILRARESNLKFSLQDRTFFLIALILGKLWGYGKKVPRTMLFKIIYI